MITGTSINLSFFAFVISSLLFLSVVIKRSFPLSTNRSAISVASCTIPPPLLRKSIISDWIFCSFSSFNFSSNYSLHPSSNVVNNKYPILFSSTLDST